MRNRILVSAAALAVVSVACGGTESVATVGDSSISYDEVISYMRVDGDVVNQDQFTRTLLGVIADRVIVAQAADDFGIARTDDEIDAQVDELIGPLTQGGVSLEDILQANALTEAGLRAIAAQGVLQVKVQDALLADLAEPSDEDLQLRYEAELPARANVCSSHILLESEEDAQAALDRALAGEDFAALAMELSTGPSGPDGGDLGCGAPSQFVLEFANGTLAAEVGVPHGPVRSSFGWHIILVSERTAPTFDELRTELVSSLSAAQAGELWTTWLVDALTTAVVSVDPEYGTWTTDPAPTIIPPGG